MDSRCDPTVSLQSALHLTNQAFNGEGVSLIIGAGCSAASATAAQVGVAARVPVISPSSTSPVLSDGVLYDYFMRTVSSDSVVSLVMIDILKSLWNYRSITLVSTETAYGSSNANVFSRLAYENDVNVLAHFTFWASSQRFTSTHRALKRSGARVFVIFVENTVAGPFLRSSYEAGIGGEGYLWFGPDTMMDFSSDHSLAENATLRAKVLYGVYALAGNGKLDTIAYQEYFSRRRQLPIFSASGCSSDTDDEGSLLFWRDHDGNASTPNKCAHFDLSVDGLYDSFGYDAVLAAAIALHHLIQVKSRSEVHGNEILDTLIHQVSFDGLTGVIDFLDASSASGAFGHGDRAHGIFFNLHHPDNSSEHKMQVVGTWTSCKDGSLTCDWSERFQLRPGTHLHAQPPQSRQVECPYGETLSQLGLCVCIDGFELGNNGQCQPCDTGTYSVQGNSTSTAGCNVCAPGYFRRFAEMPASECEPCDNVLCPVNSTVDTVVLKQGFWRHSVRTLHLVPCSWRGGWTPCRGGSDAGNDGNGYCEPGYVGPYCQVCADEGHYFDRLHARCQKCGDTAAKFVGIMLAMLFLIIALIWLENIAKLKSSSAPVPSTRNWLVDTTLKWKMHWQRARMRPKIKALVGFQQCVSAAATVFNVHAPEGTPALVREVIDVAQIQFDFSFVFPDECLGSYDRRLFIVSAWPIFLGFALALVNVCLEIAREVRKARIDAPRNRQYRDAFWDGLHGVVPTLLVIAFVLVASTATRIFKTFLCVTFEYDELIIQPFKRLEDGRVMELVQVALILLYVGILLIKVCSTSSDTCSAFGLGDTAAGVYAFSFFFGLALLSLLIAISCVRLYYSGIAPKALRVANHHSVSLWTIITRVASRR
ncbi:hypothetical protein AB1Y20_008156 [Prymnesium parvum]|uniref:Receptor ligand binding region domain-containing protein n=1 Tax=Prymnesium parvum TaxID=97485 RepID=A0AB34ITW3_PRYPA